MDLLAAALPLLLLVAPRPVPPRAVPPRAAQGEAPAPAGRVERRLAAMGTWLELDVRAADRAQALAASEAALRAIEAAEARLSTWVEDSELARANRAPLGEESVLSAELAADLAQAQEWWRATAGAFDPGLGALVAAWGLRSGGREPAPAELARARAAGGMRGFTLSGRSLVRLHEAAAFEEGAFGKGAGLDDALRALRAAGASEALVDLGGQLAVLGAARTSALADPRERARAVLSLRVPPGSLATTANSERGLLVAGRRRAHVLDPRSGEPAEDFGSLTVWAPTAFAADCLSTGLYVLGPVEAFRWRAAHPEIELLVLLPTDGGLRAFASEGWRAELTPLVPELEVHYVATGAWPELFPSAPPTSLPVTR